jgi:hypothetical protein
MRTVDLAVYLDVLGAKHAGLGAQLERSRDRLRQASIEREARRALGPETSAQLERLGVFSAADVRGLRTEVTDLAAALRSVEKLQAWVDAQLFAARGDAHEKPIVLGLVGGDEPDLAA